jgi:ComF family protein
VLRTSIRAFKYRRVTAVLNELAALACTSLDAAPKDALVVPVPAHAARVASRGIDHSGLLAQAVAERAALDFDGEAVVRMRDTPPQVGLSPRERKSNVAGAFRASRHLEQRPILLVDDVLTTGATAAECAAELISAGARRVEICTVARAAGRPM